MTETPETTEATETPKVDLAELAANGADPFLSTIWSQLDGTRQTMLNLSKDLEKYTPPNQVQVFEFVKKTEDPVIIEFRENIAKLEAKVAELRGEMNKRARTVLQPEQISDEKLSEMRAEFTKNKDMVTGQLDALKTYAKAMNKTDILAGVESFSVPRFARGVSTNTGGAAAPRNPEAHACREWAKENGMTVSEKGKISAEVWEAYRKATGK